MGTLLARLDRVHAGYGTRSVLNNLTFDVRAGEQLALLGPSGAGKSTVLRLLCAQLFPSAGVVDFPEGRPRTGLVGQEPLLFNWLTVEENIRLGHRFRANGAARPERAAELVSLLGLSAHSSSYPDQLSGGQAQRVSLGRAFAIEPTLLLLDEPFSALDPRTRDELQQWLRRTLVDEGLTSVTVTHDIDEALVLADRIVLLEAGGRVRSSWANPHPALNHAGALVHPLRAEIRRGYDPGPEADDAEFSGLAPVALEVSNA